MDTEKFPVQVQHWICQCLRTATPGKPHQDITHSQFAWRGTEWVMGITHHHEGCDSISGSSDSIQRNV